MVLLVLLVFGVFFVVFFSPPPRQFNAVILLSCTAAYKNMLVGEIFCIQIISSFSSGICNHSLLQCYSNIALDSLILILRNKIMALTQRRHLFPNVISMRERTKYLWYLNIQISLSVKVLVLWQSQSLKQLIYNPEVI